MAELSIILLALLVMKETRILALAIIGIWLFFVVVLRA